MSQGSTTRATRCGSKKAWLETGWSGQEVKTCSISRRVSEFQEPPLKTPRTQDNTSCLLRGKQSPSRQARVQTEDSLSLGHRELPGSLKEERDFDLSLEGGADRGTERAFARNKGQGTVSRRLKPSDRAQQDRAWRQWEAFRPQLGQSQAVKD